MARSSLTTPQGKPSGATYGFTLALRRILENEKPDRIAVAFDAPGRTFRHERFDDYKATRQKMPEELVGQADWMREIVRAHGIPIFEIPGYEADDVIGTLTKQAEAAGHQVHIVTGDKDFMQLVSDRVQLYNVFKQDTEVTLEGLEAVREKFGTGPEGVVEVLAVMGDSSDNVPGVKGIGEKGAKKLIEQFGSVDGLLEHLDQVKGKAREYIERDRDQLLLSRELVTIHCDVPLDPGLEAIEAPEPEIAKLVKIFTQLGFHSLLKKIEGARPKQEHANDYRTVRDAAGLEQMMAELREAGSFAVDTETTSLFPLESELVGISFSCAAGRAWYVPLNLDPPILPAGTAALLDALRPLLEDPSLARTGQNYKYDALVFAAHGVRVPPPEFDTMVASYCVAGSTRRHGLDDLALIYFDHKKIPTTDLIGRASKQITMYEVDVERVAEYACEDAEITWRLRGALEKELHQTGNWKLFHDLEMPLVSVLTAMEERGIRLDTALLSELSVELDRDVEAAEHAVQELAGENFKVNSPKALGGILFEKLRIQEDAGVKRPKRTKTGWATDAETLASRYGDVPIVQRVLEYREVQKLKSTYVDALPKFVNPKTGRVHCSFSQVTAATGRLASSDPNLQNIPVRTERGRELRKAFVAREPDELGAWALLSADYGQVELRIMAHLSGDELMRKAFEAGHDIHASTAAVVFDVDERLVTRQMRSRAKAVNFGLLYGMGPARLARETGLTIAEARTFIERYFASFPSVRGWIDRTLEGARETGYVETLFGRRRPVPEIMSASSRVRSSAENAAVNTPVQGSAADIIKQAMIDLDRRIADEGLACGLLLQVHDELVLEVPVSELERTRALVVECMQGAADLSVPLKVDCGWGRTWLDAH
jgi:DNA polymerase-1